jgi:diadenosine tetraphosphatase ApaH/serine/threonine PP2A family protein phosphatase
LEAKIFIVHGGLFWRNTTLKEIDAIDRFHEEIPRDSLQEQMLWSDPWRQSGRGANSRGCALCFGADVVDEFLDTNRLQLIVRSHECVPNGYETHFDNTLLTVFSASNYLHCDNDGAYVVFEKNCEAHVITVCATATSFSLR